MTRSLLYFTILVAGILAGTQALSQTIHLKASVNRDRILIGEPILLQLELEVPKESTHNWFNTDSIPHFELIERSKIDTQSSVGSDFYKQVLTITSFDSGSWTIPMLPLTVNNNRYLTDSIAIEVSYSNTDPSQPYHDIRDIIEVPEAEPLYINYIIAVVTLVALAVLVYLFSKRKKPAVVAAPEAVAPSLDPFEKAMQELQVLQAAGRPSGQEEIKMYYSRLNDILRIYLRDKHLVNAPDSSNAELLRTIRHMLDSDMNRSLGQSLQWADAAKFAKYQPGDAEQGQVLESLRKSIEKIEKFDNPVL